MKPAPKLPPISDTLIILPPESLFARKVWLIAIPQPRPKPRLGQTAVPGIEMKSDIEPQCNGTVSCREPFCGPQAACVTFRTLFPLRRHIAPLIDTGACRGDEKIHRVLSGAAPSAMLFCPAVKGTGALGVESESAGESAVTSGYGFVRFIVLCNRLLRKEKPRNGHKYSEPQ
jgi:hypothetical protein